jgi:hypothetical protein
MKKTMKISALALFGLAFANVKAEEGAPTIKWNVLLQGWLVNDTTREDSEPNFRIRRAELKASGTLGDNLQYFAMIDAAKGPAVGTAADKDNKILNDLGIVYIPMPGLEFTMGQFKTRTTAEGLASSSELPLPERSLIGRTFGDKREPGAMVAYKGEGFKTALMVSNGQATNVDDIDGKKDLSLRADFDVLEGLSLGAFTLASNFSFEDLGRFGVNLDYKFSDFQLRHEFVYQTATGDVKSYGHMTDLAMNGEEWSPVLRFEYLKPNMDQDLSAKAYTAGINYYLQGKKSKIQAAVSYLQDLEAPNGTPKSDNIVSGSDGTVFYLVFQAAI